MPKPKADKSVHIPPGDPPDPMAIVRTAEAYFVGAIAARNRGTSSATPEAFREDHPMVLNVAFMLDAFACELYLKALWVVTTRRRPGHSHNLRKLYELLSPPLQQQIAKGWADEKPPPDLVQALLLEAVEDGNDPVAGMQRLLGVKKPEFFAGELGRTSDDFVRWRYDFEYEFASQESGNVKDALPTVAKLIRERIPGAPETFFERNPVYIWKSYVVEFPPRPAAPKST